MDGLYWKTLLKWMIWGENPLFSETPIYCYSNLAPLGPGPINLNKLIWFTSLFNISTLISSKLHVFSNIRDLYESIWSRLSLDRIRISHNFDFKKNTSPIKVVLWIANTKRTSKNLPMVFFAKKNIAPNLWGKSYQFLPEIPMEDFHMSKFPWILWLQGQFSKSYPRCQKNIGMVWKIPYEGRNTEK